MVVENWINYKKIICKCIKVKEGIKLIYEQTKEENIDIGEFIKDENIKLFVDFSKNIIKVVKKDFIKDENKSINDLKEKDKILDLLIEYIEKEGFIYNLSSKKEFIWKIEDIDTFIKYKILYTYLHYEIFKLLRSYSISEQKALLLNRNIECLKLSYLYDTYIHIDKLSSLDKDFFFILISDVYNTINDNNIGGYIKVSDLLSNTFYIDLVFYDLYDLILYVLLDKYIHLRHKFHFSEIEDKMYNCKECGEPFFIDDYKYYKFPKNTKYCEECSKKLQQGYKDEYKEKVKIIDELRQYKGKIPKTYNDIRNEYNKFMRLIDNRKKGDKLPTLSELSKMLLKLKSIK